MADKSAHSKIAKRSPTIRDVAGRAGVSTATVSNVLTGVRPVAKESRRLVLEAIEELGFKANHMASSLRKGNSLTVGIVVPNLANEFYGALVRRYEESAARTGYELLVAASGGQPQIEALRIESLINRRVDGLLVVAAADAFGTAPGFPAKLPPTVLVDRDFGHPQYDTVASDNLGAGRLGCESLLQLGHRNITLLGAPELNSAHALERIDGYRQRIREAGVAERVLVGEHTIEGYRSIVEQELRRHDRPTAIFATTHFGTIGAAKAISAMDLKFPEEISLLGFEHAEWMTAMRPYISVISQRVDELALESWRLLHLRIAGVKFRLERIRLPCTISLRESTREPLTVKSLARKRAT
jgi:LacI family transcriptional regulator